MSKQPSRNHGENIGNIVRSAFQSGDLTRLADLGPAVQNAVQDAVKEIPGTTLETRTGSTPPATRPAQGAPQGKNFTQPDAPGYQKLSYPYDTRPYDTASAAAPRPAMQRGSLALPKGIFGIVLGVLGMVVFGLCSITFGILGMISSSAFMALSSVCGVAFAGCGVALGFGIAKNRLAARAKRYYALFDKKPVFTFAEIAAEVGRTEKQIKKDFRKMRARGWLADVHMDAGETCLMRGEDAWRLYLDSQKTQQQRAEEEAQRNRRLQNPETASIERFREEGAKTIRKIRAANDAIPGEEISKKLSRLENTCSRIFAYVEAHPAKLPETSKFMDYYLPTTLKLVEKYRQYEAMGFQPDNVKQTKAQIEDALENIDKAFKNLMESLLQEDTLDVSTDIVVLEKMLEQEGLSGNRFDIGEAGQGPEAPALTTKPS